jgi:hypothetical protein
MTGGPLGIYNMAWWVAWTTNGVKVFSKGGVYGRINYGIDTRQIASPLLTVPSHAKHSARGNMRRPYRMQYRHDPEDNRVGYTKSGGITNITY